MKKDQNLYEIRIVPIQRVEGKKRYNRFNKKGQLESVKYCTILINRKI